MPLRLFHSATISISLLLDFPRRFRAVFLGLLAMVWLLIASSCSPNPGSRKLSAPEQTVSSDSVPEALTDSAEDGTPDFLRLDTEQDRNSFRRWFTFLAEAQSFNPPARRPAEITDCSAFVRYCYREALRSHDSRWAAEAQLPLVSPFASIQKYSYPRTPLQANLFRVREGPFVPADLQNGVFAQFADAETIQRFNTFLVSRDLRRAQPGDLLFFRRTSQAHRRIFHSMIFLGRSQIAPASASYVVYHTGPEGANAGEIRRLALDDLLQFPDPQWRPYIANPQFLGVFRWNILRDPT
jgi:uncharacterized protein